MKHRLNTSKHSIIDTVKDWLTPDAIKQVQANQKKTKKIADDAMKGKGS